MFFAVAKAVLQIIALDFEHVVAFVFDLPAGSSCGDQSGDIPRSDVPIRDPRTTVNLFALRIEAFELQGV